MVFGATRSLRRWKNRRAAVRALRYNAIQRIIEKPVGTRIEL